MTQAHPGKARFDFINKRKVAYIASGLLFALTLVMLLTRGLNFGIDFSGGIAVEIRTENEVPLQELRSTLNRPEFGEVSLQHLDNPTDILIRLTPASDEEDAQIKAVETLKSILQETFADKVDYRKVDYVGPQVGSELIQAGALSLGLAFLAILVYVWLRFEWQFGVGAIIALIHDGLLTLGLFSLLGLEFNLTSIAAILTVIGYSINDSVVIYDRIRENMRRYKKMPMDELINLSLNNTLSRTILTGGSTIAALLALVLFGGDVIFGFSLAVMFGVIIGTYSSIFVAAPVLLFFNVRNMAAAKSETP